MGFLVLLGFFPLACKKQPLSQLKSVRRFRRPIKQSHFTTHASFPNTGSHLPAPVVVIKTLHAELCTPCIHQPAQSSVRILVFTIKALIIIPALFAWSVCLATYRRMRKIHRLNSSFPSRVSQGATDVSAAQCHCTGWLGLKLAEPWRAVGNLLTRLARELSTAQRGTLIRSQVGPFNKPIRASRKPASGRARWQHGRLT